MSERELLQEPIHRSLRAPSDALYREAAEIVAILRRAGFAAYLVGGSIRDMLLGEAPKDYDVATSAKPEETERLFRGPRYHTVDVGREFGTIMVVRQGLTYEVTTFRMEGRYEDGRRPAEVTFDGVDVREDVKRRDFTINGLLYDPMTEEVVDYVGGIEDLEQKHLRTIGDPQARFSEDRLRMLRAIRFVGRLKFAMEQATYEAIKAMAHRLVEVSVERIQQELTRMLTGPYPALAVRLLEETGLFAQILPNTSADPLRIARCQALEDSGHRDLAMALATLLSHEPLGHAEEGLRHLRFANPEIRETMDLLEGVRELPDVEAMGIPEQKRFLRRPLIQKILDLARILVRCEGFPEAPIHWAQQRLVVWDDAALSPPRLLDGNALKQLGYRPGPRFKEMLLALEDAQLVGEIDTEAAALAWLERSYPREV